MKLVLCALFLQSSFIGLVTATFAASLITSPAIGAHLARLYSENFIIALSLFLFIENKYLNKNLILFLGAAVAVLDLLFIYFFVPESLPDRLRTNQKISWSKIDPFGVRHDDIQFVFFAIQ